MNKTRLLIFTLFLMGILLVSCKYIPTELETPEEPQETMPYCKAWYKNIQEDYPDYPHAFIGFCVTGFQTGEAKAYRVLCGDDYFQESIGVTTRKECLDLFHSSE